MDLWANLVWKRASLQCNVIAGRTTPIERVRTNQRGKLWPARRHSEY